ncbi:MAG: ABC transporter permease, partial [Rubrivivax sp.]
MGFKFVLLWTDAALWLLFAALAGYVLHVRRSAPLRATWTKVLRDPAALCAALVLLLFLAVTALDSLHFRRQLPAAPGQAAGQVFYDSRAESVLDLVLARQIGMRESSYSSPLAYLAHGKQVVTRDGQPVREFPRLAFGGAHLKDPARDWATDVGTRAAGGAVG